MMKITRSMVAGILVIVVIFAAFAGFIAYQRNKSRGEFAGVIYSGEPASTALSINELKSAIATYERRIERHVSDAAKTANYWKILAIRLMSRGLYGDALEALEQAIFYSPEDAALHYFTGVSAGTMAKSFHVFPGRENRDRINYNALAERAFLRSVELDGHYPRPLYGLGVLYVFELDRPAEAIPYLERHLEISRTDTDTMFVLARAHYMLGNLRAALDLYDRIITITGDDQKRMDARNNRQLLLGQMHG